MAAKKGKSKGGGPKMSKIKMKNIKGKKLSSGKKTKSKDIVLARKKLQLKVRKRLLAKKTDGKKDIKEPETVIDDVLDMIPSEDLQHLRTQKYRDNFYRVKNVTNANSSMDSPRQGKKGKRAKQIEDEDDLEADYEQTHMKVMESMEEESNLLPIKTKKGFQFHAPTKLSKNIEFEEEAFVEEESETPPKGIASFANDKNFVTQEVTTAMLMAQRKRKVAEYKVRIGVLASSFLEDPENRLQNLDSLLAMMENCDESVSLMVPKLVVLSMQAIFKDVLPLYPIKHHNVEGVKLKKDTRQLQTFESGLLKRYKIYMQKLEKLVKKYCPKKDKHKLSEAQCKLGRIGLSCMCRMLESHPYFNLSVNIVNFIIPLLNHSDPEIREDVTSTVRVTFRSDKRGEITYEIVRRINMLVKSKYKPGKTGFLRKEVLDVLLVLRIKEADLEKEKEEESTSGRKMTFEQRKMLSKRQRKKAKELVQLEKELLEASAEENKSRKAHFMTEITKLVFTIYFRTLKSQPRSLILSCVLEGLAKFAHVISYDYFEDLLAVLQRLLKETELQERQYLLLISTVLTVLNGQGTALTLDPTVFQKHLYVSMKNLGSGKTESNVDLALRCVRLATGRKTMPTHRVIAFSKLLATMSLQVEHQDAIATLLQLKNIMRLHPSCSVLLDCDGAGATGVYKPELEDPDHCDAQSSTLWELVPLTNHYHPWTVNLAKGIVNPEKTEPLPSALAQLQPEDIPEAMDVSEMEFNPKLKTPSENKNKFKNSSKRKFDIFRPKTDYFNDPKFSRIQELALGHPTPRS